MRRSRENERDRLAEPRGAEGIERHFCPAFEDELRDQLPGYRREEDAVAKVAGRHVDVLLLRKRSDDRQVVRAFFKVEREAAAFAAEFGGSVLDLPVPDDAIA